MNYSAVSSRNEKLWDDYLSELAMNPRLCLARFLRKRHIVVHSFEMWMSRNGYSALQAKAHSVVHISAFILNTHIDIIKKHFRLQNYIFFFKMESLQE